MSTRPTRFLLCFCLPLVGRGLSGSRERVTRDVAPFWGGVSRWRSSTTSSTTSPTSRCWCCRWPCCSRPNPHSLFAIEIFVSLLGSTKKQTKIKRKTTVTNQSRCLKSWRKNWKTMSRNGSWNWTLELEKGCVKEKTGAPLWRYQLPQQ